MYWKVGKLVLVTLLFALAVRTPAVALACTQTCASYYRACRNDCLNGAACLAVCRADYEACNCDCGACL